MSIKRCIKSAHRCI